MKTLLLMPLKNKNYSLMPHLIPYSLTLLGRWWCIEILIFPFIFVFCGTTITMAYIYWHLSMGTATLYSPPCCSLHNLGLYHSYRLWCEWHVLALCSPVALCVRHFAEYIMHNFIHRTIPWAVCTVTVLPYKWGNNGQSDRG